MQWNKSYRNYFYFPICSIEMLEEEYRFSLILFFFHFLNFQKSCSISLCIVVLYSSLQRFFSCWIYCFFLYASNFHVFDSLSLSLLAGGFEIFGSRLFSFLKFSPNSGIYINTYIHRNRSLWAKWSSFVCFLSYSLSYKIKLLFLLCVFCFFVFFLTNRFCYR